MRSLAAPHPVELDYKFLSYKDAWAPDPHVPNNRSDLSSHFVADNLYISLVIIK